MSGTPFWKVKGKLKSETGKWNTLRKPIFKTISSARSYLELFSFFRSSFFNRAKIRNISKWGRLGPSNFWPERFHHVMFDFPTPIYSDFAPNFSFSLSFFLPGGFPRTFSPSNPPEFSPQSQAKIEGIQNPRFRQRVDFLTLPSRDFNHHVIKLPLQGRGEGAISNSPVGWRFFSLHLCLLTRESENWIAQKREPLRASRHHREEVIRTFDE